MSLRSPSRSYCLYQGADRGVSGVGNAQTQSLNGDITPTAMGEVAQNWDFQHTPWYAVAVHIPYTEGKRA